jgi:hypothetical protein
VDAEQTTLEAWDALVTYLGNQLVVPWEMDLRRTEAQVLHAVRSAAKAVAV